MTLVNHETGEVIDLDRAAAERRAERIEEHFRAIREASADLQALGYRWPRSRAPQHLYFIEAVGAERVKIGKAADVRARLADLQTGSPFELRVLGVVRGGGGDERRWHKAFADQRIHGEWFHLDDTLRICIAAEVPE